MRNIVQPVTCLRLSYPTEERFFRNPHQAFSLRCYRTHRQGYRRIAVESVDDRSYINADDITLLKNSIL